MPVTGFTMKKLRVISMDGVIAAPFSVQYLDWFVPLLGDDVDEAVFFASFLILQEGKLSIVDEFDVKWFSKASKFESHMSVSRIHLIAKTRN